MSAPAEYRIAAKVWRQRAERAERRLLLLGFGMAALWLTTALVVMWLAS